MTNEQVTIKIGNRQKAGTLEYIGNRIFFNYGYWPNLNSEIKKMEGRKYHGYDPKPRKIWSIPATQRNLFQLDYLRADRVSPYKRFDAPHIEMSPRRKLYAHQLTMLRHAATVRTAIWAAEMGTGKTLAAIELMEYVFGSEINIEDLCWYVAPKSALIAVRREFRKWKVDHKPKMMTYEQQVKEINGWKDGSKAPRMVIFDESSRVKTPSAKRSQAARILADGVRADWEDEAYILEMTGTPAPKSPADWWNQCEVACPGFLVEGNILEFKKRVGIVVAKENNLTGGKYAHLVTWRDNEAKCDVCGELKDSPNHDPLSMAERGRTDEYHAYKQSKNEVSYLYKRMKGLVLVLFKKDCLDLPEKRYVIIRVKPSGDVLRAAKLITDTAPRAVSALILLRELSDGFQYRDIQGAEIDCTNCHGVGTSVEYRTADGEPVTDPDNDSAIKTDVTCPMCLGSKKIMSTVRNAEFVGSAKDAAINNLLEQHEEVGRIVIYAGFTASIDRVVRLCHEAGWATIRVDGRGWRIEDRDGNNVPYTDSDYPLTMFQDQQAEHPLVAFIGHPGSAGMGLTLTASPSVVYFSNDFSGESRIQSEDRIHRPGMDANRGATIYDIINLPTDERVLDNLRKKRELQAMSLGELSDAMNAALAEERIL